MQQQTASPSSGLAHIDLVRGAAEAYARNSKNSLKRLQEVWQDIELPQAQQVAVLEDVISRAHLVWEEAVATAEATQQRLRGEVEAALREIAGIKEELGDDVMRRGAEAELHHLKGEERTHRSLNAWRADVLEKAAYWRNCRLQRLGEHDELQALLRQARAQIGAPQPPAADRPDISRANIEYLKLELDRLRGEKERREERLGAMMQQLRAVCVEVGEEAELALAEVHESLSFMWDSTARQVLRDVYKLAGSSAPASSSIQVDLSDVTMSRLQHKLDALGNLKAQRAAHASELMAILHSLWEACGVAAEAPERSGLVKLMGGPLRLHTRSLERCMAEVRRCEEAKVAQMLEIVNDKARELMDLCRETHIAPPEGLGGCIVAINRPEGRSPGAAADLLTKLVCMLSEIQVVAAKRGAIIGGINELEEARQEEAWLLEFEADEQRYKGRDANKKLQRAIRAQKMREKLPALAVAVRRDLNDWKEAEGAPFLYDGSDYDSLLDDLEQRLDLLAQERAAKSQARRQSGVGVGATCPSPAPRPGSSLGGEGQRTPLPKGISSRQLQERHSIAVVTSRPNIRTSSTTGAGQAQLMRSSGQISLRSTPARGAASSSSAAPDQPLPPRMPMPARTPPPAGRAGVGGAPRSTPPPSASRGVGAVGGGVTPVRPTSDRLATIFNKSPLQKVPTLQDSSRAAESSTAGEGDASASLRTPTPDVPGSHRQDDQCDLSAMFQRLVAQTSGSGSGSKDPHHASSGTTTTPATGDQGSGARGAPSGGAAGPVTGSKPTPIRGGRMSRIPQPQF